MKVGVYMVVCPVSEARERSFPLSFSRLVHIIQLVWFNIFIAQHVAAIQHFTENFHQFFLVFFFMIRSRKLPKGVKTI